MKKRKGLTLIEVLLAMTIVSIVGALVMTIFGFSLKNITSSGKRTEDILELEKELNDITFEHRKKKDGVVEVKFNIPNIDNKQIEGKVITVEKDGKKIITFIPDKVKD